jgi:hypothetical protein
VLVNPFVRQPENQSGNITVTVCLKPSGRRVLVATFDGFELCGHESCEPPPSITLPRSSGRSSAFVLSFENLGDIIVEIDTQSGRFQRVDTQTCGACVVAGAPAIPSLAVGPSGALAWVVDQREWVDAQRRYTGGFDLFLRAAGRTRRIDRRARSISHLRVSKTAVTWREAGRPRLLRLS